MIEYTLYIEITNKFRDAAVRDQIRSEITQEIKAAGIKVKGAGVSQNGRYVAVVNATPFEIEKLQKVLGNRLIDTEQTPQLN